MSSMRSEVSNIKAVAMEAVTASNDAGKAAVKALDQHPMLDNMSQQILACKEEMAFLSEQQRGLRGQMQVRPGPLGASGILRMVTCNVFGIFPTA